MKTKLQDTKINNQNASIRFEERFTTISICNDDAGNRRISMRVHSGKQKGQELAFYPDPCDYVKKKLNSSHAARSSLHDRAHAQAIKYLESDKNPVYALESACESMNYGIPLCRPVADWLSDAFERYAAICRGTLPAPPRSKQNLLEHLLKFKGGGGPGTVWTQKDKFQNDQFRAFAAVLNSTAYQKGETITTENIGEGDNDSGGALRAVIQKFRSRVPGWKSSLKAHREPLRVMLDKVKGKTLEELVTLEGGVEYWNKVKAAGEKLRVDIEETENERKRNRARLHRKKQKRN